MEISEKIYKILTHKRHRCGPLSDQRKYCLLNNINYRIFKNEPIKIIQFWGGAKNPNLNILEADICEEKSLEHLYQINKEVKRIYHYGLNFIICAGDARVEYANNIPHKNTLIYHNSFLKIIDDKKFEGIFSLIPVSRLYSKNKLFREILYETYNQTKETISDFPNNNLERLFKDSRKNIFKPADNDIKESGIKYISVMISEEKSNLYKDYENYIRSFFIKFSSDYSIFYKKYLFNKKDCFLTSRCSIYLYTVKKGCVSQPWQSVWNNNCPIGQEILKKII